MIFTGQPARRRLAGWLTVAAFFAVACGTFVHAQTDGSKKWGPYFVGGLIYSSPAVGPDGTVYVGVAIDKSVPQGSLLAIPPDGGAKKWQSDLLPDWVESSPAISPDGKTVYVGCDDGKLYAFDANSTGDKVKPKWQVDTNVSVYSSPAIGPDGTIYVGGEDGNLYAISPTGQKLWTHSVGNSIDSSPAIAPDGTIYFGSWDKKIYSLNPNNTEKWSVLTGAEVVSSPAIGPDGTVYVGSSDHKLYAIATDGRVKWTYLTDDAVVSSPVLAADGTVYVGSNDRKLYAINSDGSLRWTGPAGKAVFSTAAVRADGTVIYGSDDGVLRALNSDATNKWVFPTTAADRYIIEASPVIASDGTIYVAQGDGRLYALNGNGSPLSVYSSWPMRGHDAVHSGLKPAASTGGRLVNLSTLAPAGAGADLIVGLFISGTDQKNFLLRGIGPSLAQFPIGDPPLADPKLGLYVGQTKIRENDNWGSDGDGAEIDRIRASVGAFALPAGSKDATILASLVPGAYTSVITSADGGSGIALAEVYDAASTNLASRLTNLSTLVRVNAGKAVVPGLVIVGGSLRVLVRAVGPGLVPFGVNDRLALPTMNLFSGSSILGSNAGWTSDGRKADLAAAMSAVGAFPLSDGSADCAMLLTLNSGENYTIQVAGVGGTSGQVLVEVYVVP